MRAQPDSQAVTTSFRAAAKARVRVAELISRENADGLSLEESRELDYFLEIEHRMRLAKARDPQQRAGE